jgi:hypothetical protein
MIPFDRVLALNSIYSVAFQLLEFSGIRLLYTLKKKKKKKKASKSDF